MQFRLLCPVALTFGPVSSVARSQPAVSVGLGSAGSAQYENEVCGSLLLTSDETYESGWGWQYGGVTHPYYGAFAECYFESVALCAAVFDLTKGARLSEGRDHGHLCVGRRRWTARTNPMFSCRRRPRNSRVLAESTCYVVEFPVQCCTDAGLADRLLGQLAGRSPRMVRRCRSRRRTL